jgi:hypothetical protein
MKECPAETVSNAEIRFCENSIDGVRVSFNPLAGGVSDEEDCQYVLDVPALERRVGSAKVATPFEISPRWKVRSN